MDRVVLLPILAEQFPFYSYQQNQRKDLYLVIHLPTMLLPAVFLCANTLTVCDRLLFVIAKLCVDTTVLLPATVAMAL
eukprot:scaffold4129_cov82-Cyclotella_meneghiniana.AAC.9